MTKGELKSDLTAYFVRRPGDFTDTLAEVCLKDVHRQIQRHIEIGGRRLELNWQCMETSDGTLSVAADAKVATLPTDFKAPRRVWTVSTEDASLLLIRASTDNEIEGFRQTAAEEPGAPIIGSDNYLQRWWIEKQQLQFFHVLSDTAATTVQLDFYKFLPYYASDAANDWFSNNIWDVLRTGAEALAYDSFREYEIAELIRQKYTALLLHAYDGDRTQKTRKTKVYRPPIASARV